MQIAARLILLVAGLSTLALPRFVPPLQAHSPAASAYVPLSSVDRQTGRVAARLAGRSAAAALRWLREQHRVKVARIDPAGATIEVQFRDGAGVVILPSLRAGPPSSTAWLSFRRDQAAATPGAASGKAIVLEPFATELGLGPNAGQAEADALTSAGFHVDILRNSDVTVKVMEGLAAYSVVYIQTHAHDYGGDVILSTGETDTAPYTAMFADQSVKQAFVAGDANHLYNAVTSAFFTKYVGTFPNSSIMFLNGCDVLGANILWNALQAKNLDTMIGWDNDVYSVANEKAGEYVLDHLAQGETVAADIADTRAAGLGTAWVLTAQANLGFVGDGNVTLAAALSGATPVPTATTTPAMTPTPTPQPPPKKAHKKHKKKTRKARAKPTPTPRPARKKSSSCKAGQHKVHGKCRPKHKKG